MNPSLPLDQRPLRAVRALRVPLAYRASLVGVCLLSAASLPAAQVRGRQVAPEIVLAEQKVGALDPLLARRLDDGDLFGAAVASVGDLDGDGVGDLAVGAPGDGDETPVVWSDDISLDDDGVPPGHALSGAVWLLLQNADGSVRKANKLSVDSEGFEDLAEGDAFGSALALLDDLDGDGLRELAIGAPGDDAAGRDTGAVWIVFPNADGSVKRRTKITVEPKGLPAGALREEDGFGSALARIGDLDGDGLAELAVGAPGIDARARDTGGVWVLFLRPTGYVRRSVLLSASSGQLGFVQKRGDRLGAALAALGDLNGDGTPDLAVGAPETDDGAVSSGAVWLLFLRPSGLVAAKRKISAAAGPLRTELERNDLFGSALAMPGDLDGDGVGDLLVGAPSDDDAAAGAGAVWVLSLRPNGSVQRQRKIASGPSSTSGFDGALHALDLFGSSLAALEDLDGLARPEVAVGAPGDDDGGTFSFSGRGAVWVLFLDDGTHPQADVRNGSGLNQLTYQSTNLPFVGQTWVAEIDASHHAGATLTVIMAFDRPHAGVRTSFGEVLVGLRGLGGRRVFRSVADSGGALAVHANPIPGDLSLAGHQVFTQGVILGRGIELLNAIDLRVGY